MYLPAGTEHATALSILHSFRTYTSARKRGRNSLDCLQAKPSNEEGWRLCKLRPEARSPLGPVLFPSSAEFLAAARSQAGPLLSRNHTARRQQPQAGKRSKQTMAGFLVLLPFSHDLDPKTLLSGLSHKALQNKLLPFFFFKQKRNKRKNNYYYIQSETLERNSDPNPHSSL